MVWNRVSASQVENYNKCHRQWFFKSVLRLPEPQSGRQALGESFHLVLETVPVTGIWPAQNQTQADPEEWRIASELAKLALPLLPEPQPGRDILREAFIKLDTYPNGPEFIGYIDLAIPRGVGWPAFLIPSNEAIIGDYKTLSDFRYMKTPEELANSVQMMSYAKWAIEPGNLVGKQDLDLYDLNTIPATVPDFVRLVHLYAKTRGNITSKSIRHESAVVDHKQINTFWNKTLDTIREMQNTANTCGSADDVDATGALTGHCDAYGGCSFRDKCGIPKASGISGLFQIAKSKPKENSPDMSGSSILAKIQAARAAQGLASATPATPAPTSETPPAVVETPTTKPSAGPVSTMLDKIFARTGTRPALGGQVAQTYGKEIGSEAPGFAGTGSTQVVNTLGDLMKLAAGQAVGVVPPDAPSREQPVITKPGDTVTEVTAPTDEDEEASETPVVTQDPAPPGAPAPIENAPKKRGRPPGSVNKAPTSAAHPAPVVVDPNPALLDRIAELEAALAKAQSPTVINVGSDAGTTLYVDCFPIKGDSPVDFFEWISPIASAVAESNGVKDWRLIDYKGKGLLATHIRELVKAEGMPKAMSIGTWANGADVALEILTPLAKRVIRKI